MNEILYFMNNWNGQFGGLMPECHIRFMTFCSIPKNNQNGISYSRDAKLKTLAHILQ